MDYEARRLEREAGSSNASDPQQQATAPVDPAETPPAADSASSERRIAANRLNARRSTGPRTAYGKLRSRANALKHGLSAAQIVVAGFEDAAEFERMHANLLADLAPMGSAEELLVREIAVCFWRLGRLARMEVAQAYLAQRAAILQPYIGSPSSSDIAHQRLDAREREITLLKAELAYLEGLANTVEEGMVIGDEVRERLAQLSVAELFEADDADAEQVRDRLLYACERLRVVLDALESSNAPVAIRASAVLAPSDPARYHDETHRRLGRLFHQLNALQERRLARQAPPKRPPRSAPVIEITAAEESV